MANFSEFLTADQYFLTKIFFQRGLAIVYVIGFLIALDQGPGLLGSHGLLPIRLYVEKLNFWDSPSLFFWNSGDGFVKSCAWVGLIISILAVLGWTERLGALPSLFFWLVLWVLYLSFVNVGQTFYSFGWESMLLETGFLAIFLGPANAAPPMVVIWLLRWVCFRNMFGAGLIKWRGDASWRDLTCMNYYYETQPIPNPLSIYFHRLPTFVHKLSVIWTFFVELIVPFGLLSPWWPLAAVAGLLSLSFHLLIGLSGNLAFLNFLSMVLCIPCFCDPVLRAVFPWLKAESSESPTPLLWLSYALGLFVAWRSIGPIQNLISPNQVMNTSFDRLHLVNTYGAFGTITKERRELIVLGTLDEDPESAEWKAYEFKGKPGDVNRMPPFMSPYHWRLDWLMWFAAFSDYRYSPWILNFVAKLLEADKDVLHLLRVDPFQGQRPRWIKVDSYLYHFQDPQKNGWWQRSDPEEWLPPLNLEQPAFRAILEGQGWMDVGSEGGK